MVLRILAGSHEGVSITSLIIDGQHAPHVHLVEGGYEHAEMCLQMLGFEHEFFL